MAPRTLEVWFSAGPASARVGTLSQVAGRLGFAYAPDWLAQDKPWPLSQSLSLRAEDFDDKATRPFFAGLLPEGEQRRLVAQALQASRQNDFALLAGIGGECAGAVTLLDPGQTPAPPAEANSLRWLDQAELQALLADLPQRPMLAGQQGLRLSLAGAQDKLPVVVGDDGRIGLPLFGAPSTHILKPAIAGLDGTVFNEAFCMRLAAALKLAVAPVQIHPVAQGGAVLLVQRYDRLAAAGPDSAPNPAPNPAPNLPPTRLHQEDFCQALAVPPEQKYQNEGGPDLAQCFALLRRATRPSALPVLALLDAVVFNALIGNHDAHGKNFSLLYGAAVSAGSAGRAGGPADATLAPLYDLLCTAVYPRLTDKMAMKLGGQYRFSALMARHWERFARDAGLSPAQVKKRVMTIASRLPDLARQTAAAFDAQGQGHPILGQIVTLIAQRCALTVRRLSAPAGDSAGDAADDAGKDDGSNEGSDEAAPGAD
jgi:serine/threonine-protein kinase HipA